MWKKLSLKLKFAILLWDALRNRGFGEFKIQYADTEMASLAELCFYTYCISYILNTCLALNK